MSSQEKEQVKKQERNQRRRDILIFGALAIAGAAILAPLLTKGSIWNLGLTNPAGKLSH